ncbi:MAG: bifunctional glutamate N-acetyltransferase/amino-acid acetyltransferase ArgJ, partial [Gammaproteobacteria bacterium]|nr:bifunctional glutamate N-acetyltransferase/amino-acid acetyltransferase ArgJ [Gammaproteobacteria bacterium]
TVAEAVRQQQVIPFSTGVIGEQLPSERIVAALPAAVADLDAENWAKAANAILTTDTVAKGVSERLFLGGREVTITGIAKGSGMIRPDMATMLSFIATDLHLPQALLQQQLRGAVAQSFNRITVDGDTSTNDAVVLVATGKSGVALSEESEDLEQFAQALKRITLRLAQLIIRDGEGATRFIEIAVEEAATEREALEVAYTVAHSPLVKTAFFAGDPNLGRILAAVGRAKVDRLNIGEVDISLGDTPFVIGGEVAPQYREEQGAAAMAEEEIVVTIVLGRGRARASVWTSDLSYEYVRINAEYRT